MVIKKIGTYILVATIASGVTGGVVLYCNNQKENKVVFTESKIITESNLGSQPTKAVLESGITQEYTADNISIMGFSELDYMKAMSFILTKGSESPYGIEAINFNGLTIEEHLANLNAAAYCENIDPIVMLCQQILETSIYMYKCKTPDEDGNMIDKISVVKASDYNFAGIGATDGDGRKNVNSFLSNAEGQLAQAQHLKAYASDEDVNTILVDRRFNHVENRGDANTISGLSARWASNEGYGNHIARLYNQYLEHDTDTELVKKYYGKKF